MCECIEKLNKMLEEKKVRVETMIYFDGSPTRIPICTAKISTGKPSNVTLQPDYCPVCGEKYQ